MASWDGGASVLANRVLPPSFINHPSLGKVRYELTEVSDDPDTQVAQTIALMKRYALEDSSHPILINDASAAVQSMDPISDTFEYLRRNGGRGMQFVRDEDIGSPFADGWRPLVEALIRPADQALLSSPQGDCDDFSMYGAAHLLARGVPCSFATVAASDSDPSAYSHVYLVAYPKSGPYAGQRVPLDLSHGPYPGWEVPNRFGKRAEWGVDHTSDILLWGLALGGAYLLYKGLN
jgi:hypothetical protein